jgi:hypothetical protein
MDLNVLSALQGLRLQECTKLEKALSEILVSNMSSEPVTIKGARDRFSEINRRARNGQIQVIKGTPGEETIIVSMRDLAAMIHASVKGVSFADVLEASGFKPVLGQRLELSEGLKRGDDLALEVSETERPYKVAAAV